MAHLSDFLIELDKLKAVLRNTYISDGSRNENSAEHSWHMAMAILVLKDELDIDLDLIKAVKMALVHDVCEIGAGDISIYDPERSKKKKQEQAYVNKVSKAPVKFAGEIQQLWAEYEAQETRESHWVKVADRLLPFVLNISNQGKSWKEKGITSRQVKEIIKGINKQAPEIHEWMVVQIKRAVALGWLIDGDRTDVKK